MIDSTIKKTIFFILISVFFMVFFVISKYLTNCNLTTTSGKVMLFVSSAIFSASMLGMYVLTGLSGESFTFEVTPGKMCQGGPYMWQGNSKTSKMCRKMAETSTGQKEINRYDCGVGFMGLPEHHFDYTPISNDDWKNERCAPAPSGENGIF